MASISNFVKRWVKNARDITLNELKRIFTDGGVMIIFFIGGLLYPLLYNAIYYRGQLEDMPVAVVDQSGGPYSRRYVRELDATRECAVTRKCADLREAERLMQQGEIHGIILIPKGFDEAIVRGEQGTISTYADMSSFLYYKNVTMGTSYVMLDEVHAIQGERYSAAGFTDEEARTLISPVGYGENMPYNRSMSYTIFFISAALMLVIQQTLFYGSTLLSGTMREQNRSFASLPARFRGIGVGRVILGRGMAYFLIYAVVGTIVLLLTPWLFHLPQKAEWTEILLMLFVFVWDCIFFSFTGGTMITRRETVFVLFLFMSPICMFLTGFSWPMTNVPKFWQVFSYIFPSTFGCRAFINLNTAGGTIGTVAPEIIAMTIQAVVYYFLAFVAMLVEHYIQSHRDKLLAMREELARKVGFDMEKHVYEIGGEEALEEYRRTGRIRREIPQ